MIRRFLWGASAGVLFAVICVMAAAKTVWQRATGFEGKQERHG